MKYNPAKVSVNKLVNSNEKLSFQGTKLTTVSFKKKSVMFD